MSETTNPTAEASNEQAEATHQPSFDDKLSDLDTAWSEVGHILTNDPDNVSSAVVCEAWTARDFCEQAKQRQKYGGASLDNLTSELDEIATDFLRAVAKESSCLLEDTSRALVSCLATPAIVAKQDDCNEAIALAVEDYQNLVAEGLTDDNEAIKLAKEKMREARRRGEVAEAEAVAELLEGGDNE